MQEKAKHPVKTLKKTIEIIEELKRSKSATLSELSAELDMNKSVVHNHLSTLQEHGYIVKREDRYQLSLHFLTIGGILRDEMELYTAAKSQVDELTKETGELVTLATQELGRAIVLYCSKGEQAVEIDTHVGSQVTLHSSAFGKAILANMPKDDIREIIDIRGLEAHTPSTITDREALFTELDQIADKGYATDSEEQWRGLQCVASPILMEDGTVKGAISISAPKSRMADEEIQQKYINDLKDAVNIIELHMTYA